MRSQLWKVSFGVALSLSLGMSLSAQTVTTIRNNGNSANRVDLVILGDGYTAAQLGTYATHVTNTINSLFAQEPYREYQNYFNIHRINVTSAQSGADHPERSPRVFVNTALNATYNCSGIQRLICVNTTTVNNIVNSLLAANQRDMILVLVNDTEYGGSGGSIAVASLNASVVELVLHEVGHSFGLLADEYGGPPPPNCNSAVEPSEANATRQSVLASSKWSHWSGVAGVGNFQGAKYCDTGLYRPTSNSKMRTLGQPFLQINSEQHIRRFYNFVPAIDSSAPGANVTVSRSGPPATFSVVNPLPFTHTLTVSWSVDGVAQGSGTTFVLNAAPLTVGAHTVRATVTDTTAMVRNWLGLFPVIRTWNVTVNP